MPDNLPAAQLTVSKHCMLEWPWTFGSNLSTTLELSYAYPNTHVTNTDKWTYSKHNVYPSTAGRKMHIQCISVRMVHQIWSKLAEYIVLLYKRVLIQEVSYALITWTNDKVYLPENSSIQWKIEIKELNTKDYFVDSYFQQISNIFKTIIFYLIYFVLENLAHAYL